MNQIAQTIVNGIRRCEALYEKRKTVKRAVLLVQRYIVSYFLIAERPLLHKANFTVTTEFAKNPWCFELYFYSLYIKLALGHREKAVEMLENIKNHKASLRKNDSGNFLVYMYFSILLSDGSKKTRLRDELNSYAKELPGSDTAALKNLCLLKASTSTDEGFKYFNTYINNSQTLGVMFFVKLAQAFENIMLAPKSANESIAKEIVAFDLDKCIPVFFKWAVRHGYDLSDFFSKIDGLVASKLSHNIKTACEIYRLYPNNKLLEVICTSFMLAKDYSENALYYYKEAESKQMLMPKLYEFVILSACKNGAEDLSRYSISSFLDLKTLEQEYKPFVYHVLLTNKKYLELVKKYSAEIIQFGIICLERNLKGRYYYSIYKFLLDVEQKEAKSFINAPYIEKLLHSQLFSFEITVDNPTAKHIFVFEKEKYAKKFYEIINKKAIIKATGDNFSYFLFNDGKRSVVDGKIKIKRMVENADIKIYRRFFYGGNRDIDLLIALSKYYMGFEKPPEECLEILNETVSNNNISKQFRMQISATLGNYYSYIRNYVKSVSYYKTADENLLGDRHIEQMLLAYISARQYKLAVNLIVKKGSSISDKSMFFALKQISTKSEFNSMIANYAYSLIVKSWYDKTLINIVLNHYHGSQNEWQEFSKALSAMNASEKSLDEIIIRNSIRMHKLDSGAQNIFSRMFESDSQNSLIGDFSKYCAYEMIINNIKPDYATIDILERIFLKSSEPIIAYALSHIYINYDMSTFNSDKILKAAIALCEQEGILYPVFKMLKDKTLLTPYIEKNQPFIYKGFPGKTVLLHYKPAGTGVSADTSAGYRVVKMKYTCFGLYLAHVTHFYSETISYFISEEMPTGSISSKEQTIENNRLHVLNNTIEPFYIINNAIIFEQMFKYDKVEEIITDRLKDFPRVKSWII